MEIFNNISKIQGKENITTDTNKIVESKEVIKIQNEKISEKNRELDETKTQLEDIVSMMNNNPIFGNSLKFSVHQDSDVYMVSVLEKDTDNLIVQYPSESFIKQMKYTQDNLIQLFDKKA